MAIEIPLQLRSKHFRFCKITPNTKAPSEVNWQKSMNYKWDEPEFQEYLKTASAYGVICGFGFLAVIDADNEKFYNKIWLKLPKTFSVRTGSGKWHLYYIIKDLKEKIVVTDNNNIHYGEVQFNDSQILGCGSKHPNGNLYEILEDIPIAEIKKKDLDEVLKPFLKTEEKSTSSGMNWSIENVASTISGLDKNPDGSLQGIHPVHNSTTGKNFNINLDKGVWHCFRCGTGGDAVTLVAMLEGIVECAECTEGYFKEHPEKFKEILKIAPKYGYELPENKTIDTLKSEFEKTQVKPFVDKNLIEEIKQYWDEYWVKDEWNKYHFYACELANRITYKNTGENRGFLVLNDKNTTILYYTEGVYSFNAENYINGIIHNVLGKMFSKNRATEVLTCIKTDPELKITMEDMQVDSRYICFKNCIYDRTDKVEIPFSPEFKFINKINADYNPKVKCPNIKKFLSEVVKPTDIITLLEIPATMITRDYKYQYIYYLNGCGSNGKTIYCNLLDVFLGFDNVSHETIKDLTENTFSLSKLRYKLANIGDDVGYQEIPTEASSGLKRISGRQKRLSSQGKYEQAVDSPFYSVLMFNCNELPIFEDKTDGMSRRNVAVIFPNQFIGTKENKNLLDEIITEQEKSGFINLVLEALEKLEKRKQLTNAKSIADMRDKYQLYAQPVSIYIKETYEFINDRCQYVDNLEIYSECANWCTEKNYKIPSKKAFWKLFNEVFPTAIDCKQDFAIDSSRPWIHRKIRKIGKKSICTKITDNDINRRE